MSEENAAKQPESGNDAPASISKNFNAGAQSGYPSSNNNVYISPAGKKALGESYADVTGQANTPVAFVTAADPHREPEKLKQALGIPATQDASALNDKAFSDKVAMGTPTSKAAADPSGVCAVSIPEAPETLGATFNRIAHIDPRAGAPQLGVDPGKPDPGINIVHELGHCDQKPIRTDDPNLVDKVLAGEAAADRKAKAAFPQHADLLDGARALGGQHDSMKDGDVDHAVSLYNASGGKLSANEIGQTYEGLNRKIGQQYAHDPRADPERVNFALNYALDPSNMSGKTPLSQEDQSKIEAAREQIGTHPATKILAELPTEAKQGQGIENTFYSKSAEYMPRDPRLISEQIKKIDPAALSPNEQMVGKIYTDAADRYYPPQVEGPTRKPAPKSRGMGM